MPLSHLSLEIWLSLARLVTVSDLWALVACGDRQLSRKLRSNSILTAIDIDESNIYMMSSLVKQKRLDRVSELFVDASNYDLLAMLSPALSLSSMRSLDFATVDHPSPTESGWYSFQEVFNVAELMPCLEHFGLFCWPGAGSKGLMRRFIFPDSLTSLCMTGVTDIAFAPSINIPPHLRRLDCHNIVVISESSDGSSTIRSLPTSLTSLGVSMDCHESETWSRNSTALKDMAYTCDPQLSCERLRELIYDKKDDHLIQWEDLIPQNWHHDFLEPVRAMHKNRFRGWGSFHHLPLLTDLSLSDIGGQYHSVAVDVVCLPASITKLSFNGSIQNALKPWFPPNITALHSPHKPLYTPEQPYPTIPYLKELTTPYMQAKSPHRDIPLTSFNSSSYAFDPALTPMLPSTLTYLSLGSGDIHFSIIGLLPRTLTELECYNYPMKHTDLVDLSRQYSGLLKREDESHSLMNVQEGAHKEIPHFWPPNLMSLALYSACASLMELLPKTLTYYRIIQLSVQDEVFPRLVAHLPSALVDMTDAKSIHRAIQNLYDSRQGRLISGVETDFTAEGSFPHLGPITEKIDLSMFHPVMKASNFAQFTKLRKLVSTKQVSISDCSDIFQYLPPTIKTVDIDCKDAEVCDAILLALPADLHKLRLRTMPITLATVKTTFNDGEQGHELNDATLEAGFADLIDAEFGRVLVKTTPIDLLLTPPSTLQFPLTISSIDLSTDIGDPIFYALLPSTLTNLRIVDAPGVTNESLSSLPASLRHLEFTKDNSLTSICTSSLPMLLSFILPTNGKLTSEALFTLPKSLKTLNLRSALLVNDSGVSALPLSITSLNISWACISDRVLPMLPRELTELDIENCELLASASPESLPPSLTKLVAPQGMLDKCTPELFPLLTNTQSAGTEMTGLFDF